MKGNLLDQTSLTEVARKNLRRVWNTLNTMQSQREGTHTEHSNLDLEAQRQTTGKSRYHPAHPTLQGGRPSSTRGVQETAADSIGCTKPHAGKPSHTEVSSSAQENTSNQHHGTHMATMRTMLRRQPWECLHHESMQSQRQQPI